MPEQESDQRREAKQGEGSPSPVVLLADELFQGQREICIEHQGQRYGLRITRRNKLILQK